MQGDENNGKKEEAPAPIRVNQKVMDWLYQAQESARVRTGKRASFSALIESLIETSEQSGTQVPYERDLTYERSMVKSINDSPVPTALNRILIALQELKQTVENKGSIDYRKVQRACADAIKGMDTAKHSRSLSEIKRIKSASKEISEGVGKGTGGANPKRGIA